MKWLLYGLDENNQYGMIANYCIDIHFVKFRLHLI